MSAFTTLERRLAALSALWFSSDCLQNNESADHELTNSNIDIQLQPWQYSDMKELPHYMEVSLRHHLRHCTAWLKRSCDHLSATYHDNEHHDVQQLEKEMNILQNADRMLKTVDADAEEIRQKIEKYHNKAIAARNDDEQIYGSSMRKRIMAAYNAINDIAVDINAVRESWLSLFTLFHQEQQRLLQLRTVQLQHEKQQHELAKELQVQHELRIQREKEFAAAQQLAEKDQLQQEAVAEATAKKHREKLQEDELQKQQKATEARNHAEFLQRQQQEREALEFNERQLRKDVARKEFDQKQRIRHAVDKSLGQLRKSLTLLKSSSDYQNALTTLLRYIGNTLDNPLEDKYRHIRFENSTFQARLGRHPGGIEALRAVGFTDVTIDDPMLVLRPDHESWSVLTEARKLIETELAMIL